MEFSYGKLKPPITPHAVLDTRTMSRGGARGATYSWYTYSPIRLKYPLIRSALLEMWRDAVRWHSDPVAAWRSIVEEPGQRHSYQKERGKGGFVRVSWDEAAGLVAASLRSSTTPGCGGRRS